MPTYTAKYIRIEHREIQIECEAISAEHALATFEFMISEPEGRPFDDMECFDADDLILDVELLR